MRDQVPVIVEGQGCVVNLDSAGGPGTHWVCVWKRGGKYWYFDSYGFPPPAELEGRKPLLYSDGNYQPIDSTKCGYYAVDVLRSGLRGKKLADIVRRWSEDDHSGNDKDVIKNWPGSNAT